MKLSEIKVGDTIFLDRGFTCHCSGPVLVYGNQNDVHSYYFKCDAGKHYLDGQQVDGSRGDDTLIGIHPYK